MNQDPWWWNVVSMVAYLSQFYFSIAGRHKTLRTASRVIVAAALVAAAWRV